MAVVNDGECIFDLFFRIPSVDNRSRSVDIPAARTKDCCQDFKLKVLASIGVSDEFKDDVSGFLYKFDLSFTGAVIELLKYDNTVGDYAVAETITDNTYGTYYDFGFYENDDLDNYIGFQCEWKKILEDVDLGTGSYKIKCTGTNFASGVSEYESAVFCLYEYTPQRADKTVKVEYYRNGLMGDLNNDEKHFDYGTLNWYSAIRLNGFFGYPGSEFTRDNVQYNTGQKMWVKDEREPEFMFKLRPIPAFIHNLFEYEIMQADDILITDYNANNAATWIQKKVKPTSAYKPGWRPLLSKLAPIELTFEQAFNNLKKRRN